MVTFLSIVTAAIMAIFKGKQARILENLALRQQLRVYVRKEKRPPRLKTQDRTFWVLLSKTWDGWKSTLIYS
jgi:hypothetical protein